MMKMRIALVFGLLAIICLSVHAEDPKAEPESSAEPESEPEGHHHDHGHDEDSHKAGSSVSKSGDAKAASGKNLASATWAFSVPAILGLSAVAKFIL